MTNMRKIVSFIPNLFTLGNLFCGCLSIIAAFYNYFDIAAILVLGGAFLDFFDGFLARILNVTGDLGKQLDSLADMVTFGVAPGMLLVQFMVRKNMIYDIEGFWAIIPLLIPIFSAYRLAKFNLDTRQTQGFLGLPTPANALFFVSIVYCYIQIDNLGTVEGTYYFQSMVDRFSLMREASRPFVFISHDWQSSMLFHITSPLTLCLFIGFFCLLMVSEIPLFGLKFKNFGWADNKIRYVFLALCTVLLILFQFIAIPFIVILYILTSIVNNIFKLTV